jgi:hypothetical protein
MTGMRNRATPASHDTRKESRRRLVVGFSGLTAMLLLVVLAGLVTDRARQEADAAMAQAQAAGVANPGTGVPPPANEPLADLGVAPSVDGTATPAPAPAAAAPPAAGTTATGRVPDLQPDPELEAQKSMR